MRVSRREEPSLLDALSRPEPADGQERRGQDPMVTNSYHARTYEARGSELVISAERKFNTAEEAVAYARRAAERKPGAVAYAVTTTANPELASAVVLFRSGQIPVGQNPSKPE